MDLLRNDTVYCQFLSYANGHIWPIFTLAVFVRVECRAARRGKLPAP